MVVTRWSQSCNKAGDSCRVGTTLLHACKHRCIDQYTHAKQPRFQIVKYVHIYIHVYLQCMDTAHERPFTLYLLYACMIRNQSHAHKRNLLTIVEFRHSYQLGWKQTCLSDYVTTVHPQLSKPRLSDTLIIQTQNLSSHTHIYESHMQNGVFQLLKQRGVPKMYWLSKRSWIFASSWLQINPTQSATEVEDRL